MMHSSIFIIPSIVATHSGHSWSRQGDNMSLTHNNEPSTWHVANVNVGPACKENDENVQVEDVWSKERAACKYLSSSTKTSSQGVDSKMNAVFYIEDNYVFIFLKPGSD